MLESLWGCGRDLEMVCTVYTARLKGRASVGRRTLLAWEARCSDPTSLSVSHSPSFSSCSGARDGLGKINASSTECREIKLVYSDPETWRSQARAAAGTIPPLHTQLFITPWKPPVDDLNRRHASGLTLFFCFTFDAGRTQCGIDFQIYPHNYRDL